MKFKSKEKEITETNQNQIPIEIKNENDGMDIIRNTQTNAKQLIEDRYDKFYYSSNSNFKSYSNYNSMGIYSHSNNNETDPGKFKVLKTSQDIIKNTYKKAFISIFDSLDYQKVKTISGIGNLENSNLPCKLKAILSPLLTELEKENQTLNEMEFILVCEDLLKVKIIFVNVKIGYGNI